MSRNWKEPDDLLSFPATDGALFPAGLRFNWLTAPLDSKVANLTLKTHCLSMLVHFPMFKKSRARSYNTTLLHFVSLTYIISALLQLLQKIKNEQVPSTNLPLWCSVIVYMITIDNGTC